MNLERNLRFQQKYFPQQFESYGLEKNEISMPNNLLAKPLNLGDKIIILVDKLGDITKVLFPELPNLDYDNYTSINIYKKAVAFHNEILQANINFVINHPYPTKNLCIRLTKKISQTDLETSEVILTSKNLSLLEKKKLQEYSFKVITENNIAQIQDFLSVPTLTYPPLKLEYRTLLDDNNLNFDLSPNVYFKLVKNIIKEIEAVGKIDEKHIQHILSNYIYQEFDLLGIDWIKDYITDNFFSNCYIIEQYLKSKDAFKDEINKKLPNYVTEIMTKLNTTFLKSDIYPMLINTNLIEIDELMLCHLNKICIGLVNYK